MARELSLVRRIPPRLVTIQTVVNGCGRMGVVETQTHSPFDYARFYFLTDLPQASRRGGHAHRTLQQVILCLRGAATIRISSTSGAQTFRLDRCDQAIVLPAGYWRDLYGFSDDALIGVLASERYDEADYIRDWDEYAAWDRASFGQSALSGAMTGCLASQFVGPPPPESVPYLDLARYTPLVGPAMASAVGAVIQSGRLIGGPELQRFETSFAAYCETGFAVGVGNGLQALALALRAAGIGAPGPETADEVILPANSFVATALAVVEAGAVPVLVDIEPDTGLICPVAVAAAITERTRAIIAVHLYGHPADMDTLRQVADRARRQGDQAIFLLEDSCQAHGARYKGRRCGSLGDAAAFSFYPTKNLGAVGDAGAIVTANRGLAARVRLLGNYGSEARHRHVIIGTNSRLDPVQAAALGVKLPYLDSWNAIRASHAAQYMMALRDIPDLVLPTVRPWAEPAWHVFPVRVPAVRRAAFIAALAEQGIGTSIHYPTPIHLQECFAGRGWGLGSFPVTERLADELVSLPLDPTHTLAEIGLVADAVRMVCYALTISAQAGASALAVADECLVQA